MPKLYSEKAIHEECSREICKLFQQRLKTFKEWNGLSSPEYLAHAGFAYYDKANEVSCSECALHVNLQIVDSRHMLLHKTKSPNCPFVLKHLKEAVSNQPTELNTRQYYSDIEKRLQSFEGWPLRDFPLRPEVMSRCGFYYTGIADKVVCFLCGLELRDWKIGHCPIYRHEESGKCSFISETEAVSIRQENKDLRELMETDDYNCTEIFHFKPNTPSCIMEGSTCTNQQCQSCEPISKNEDTKKKPSMAMKHPQYSSIQNRLDSFISWPLNTVAHSPEIMSESGFFYTGSADKVTCYSCGVTLRGWHDNISPPVQHREVSPDCSHVLHLDINALMKTIHELRQLKMEYDDYNCTEMFDDTSTQPIELLQEGLICEDECPYDCSFERDCEHVITEGQQGDHNQVTTEQNPKRPEFSLEQSRLESFTSWPLSQFPHSPEIMSQCGFFYTGSADKVTCFFCGVTLRDWQENEDPAIAHMDISANCLFMKVFDIEGFESELKELEELINDFDDYNCTEMFDRWAIRRSDSGVSICHSKFVGMCTESG